MGILLLHFLDGKQVKALTSHTFLDLPESFAIWWAGGQQKRYTNGQRNFKLAKINRNFGFSRTFLQVSIFVGWGRGWDQMARTFVGDSVWFLKCKLRRHQRCTPHKYQYAEPRVTWSPFSHHSYFDHNWMEPGGCWSMPPPIEFHPAKMHRNHQQQIGQTTCLGIPATQRGWTLALSSESWFTQLLPDWQAHPMQSLSRRRAHSGFRLWFPYPI